MLGSLVRRIPLQTRLLSTALPTNFMEWKDKYYTSNSDSHLNAWLVSNIGNFRDDEVWEVLRAIRLHKTASIDPALAIALENELDARIKDNWKKSWRLLFQASKVYGKMKKAGVDMVPLFSEVAKKYINSSYLSVAPLAQVALVVSTYSKVQIASRQNSEFTLASGERIFEVAKATFPARLKDYKQDDMGYWYMVLGSAITQNWGTDDFLKNLEQRILPGISNLPASSLAELAAAYTNRKCNDYHYLQECYQRPYHRELERVSKDIGPKLVSQAFSYLSSPKSIPFYCDEQFTDFLIRVLKAKSWCGNSETLLSVTFSVLQLITRIGLTSPDLINQIRINLITCTNYISLTRLPHFARHYSMLNAADDHFWNMFYRNLPRLLQNSNIKQSLSATILNFSVHNKEMHKKCMELPEMQQGVESLKADRAAKHLKYWQEWISQPPCKAVEGYLARTGLEFVKGHFDDFYIDFAFPKQKLAVDVCTEQHFVLPALSLCGQKQVKKAILESKGWRYEVLPLLSRPTDAVAESKAKDFFDSRITQ